MTTTANDDIVLDIINKNKLSSGESGLTIGNNNRGNYSSSLVVGNSNNSTPDVNVDTKAVPSQDYIQTSNSSAIIGTNNSFGSSISNSVILGTNARGDKTQSELIQGGGFHYLYDRATIEKKDRFNYSYNRQSILSCVAYDRAINSPFWINGQENKYFRLEDNTFNIMTIKMQVTDGTNWEQYIYRAGYQCIGGTPSLLHSNLIEAYSYTGTTPANYWINQATFLVITFTTDASHRAMKITASNPADIRRDVWLNCSVDCLVLKKTTLV